MGSSPCAWSDSNGAGIQADYGALLSSWDNRDLDVLLQRAKALPAGSNVREVVEDVMAKVPRLSVRHTSSTWAGRILYIVQCTISDARRRACPWRTGCA